MKEYEEKPSINLHRFSGYQCAFSFNSVDFDDVAFMELSTLRKPLGAIDIRNTPIYNSLPLEVRNTRI